MRNFNITDEERQSILRLHETSTKKQYLNVISEQTGTALDSLGKLPTSTIQAPQSKVPATQQPTTNATLKDVQSLLITLGYKISKDGTVDGKLGPLTLNALMTALKSATPNAAPNTTPKDGQTPGGVNVVDELMKIPEVKAIADKLKAANIDLSKMTPEQILPKVQELAGDILKANPNLINTVKTQIETLMNIKLPDLTNVSASTPANAPVVDANQEQKGRDVLSKF